MQLEMLYFALKVLSAFGFMGVLCSKFFNDHYYNEITHSDKDDVNTQLYYFYLIALILCGIIYVFMGSGQFNSVNFDPTTQFIFREWFSNFDYTWKFILFFGVAASIAFVCIFSAYIVASPSVVSLFEYSLIIMSMIPGYFLFNEIPSLER
jgi:drug/metabolite transporter (DMT)-like permease